MEKDIEKIYQDFLNKIEYSDKNGLMEETEKLLVISGLDNEKQKDILFCIYWIFFMEISLKEILKELLLDALKLDMKHPQLINLIFEETTFISKIKITEFIINFNPQYKKDYAEFFSFCRALNDTRNQIFHVKLENIKYKDLPISDINTQRKIIRDFINARFKMGRIIINKNKEETNKN
jgi:hypothetical protein